MTKEEAIRHIRDVIAENNSIKPNIVTFEQEKEALYMAIEALMILGEDGQKNEWNDYEDPPIDGIYIIAWVWQHEECPYPHYYALDHWDKMEGGYWEYSSAKPVDVLAWMPLPEWYKENGEADD